MRCVASSARSALLREWTSRTRSACVTDLKAECHPWNELRLDKKGALQGYRRAVLKSVMHPRQMIPGQPTRISDQLPSINKRNLLPKSRPFKKLSPVLTSGTMTKMSSQSQSSQTLEASATLTLSKPLKLALLEAPGLAPGTPSRWRKKTASRASSKSQPAQVQPQ